MREQINRLAKGIMEYEQAQLVIPKEISKTISGGVPYTGELRICREDMRELKGVIYSTDPRVIVNEESFCGKDCRVGYRVEAATALEPVTLTGEFTLVTGCGEAAIPYTFVMMPDSETVEPMETLEEFAALAEADPLAALQAFNSPAFIRMPFMQQLKLRTLYDGLRFRGNQLIAMEEFLVGCGAKEEVHIRADETEKTYRGINESIEDSIIIEKNTWGTVRIELSAEGGFITLPVTLLTEEDFVDGQAKVRFKVEREAMHRGVNRGAIRIKNIRRSFAIPVAADCARTAEKVLNHSYMTEYGRFVRLAVQYMALEGRTDMVSDGEKKLQLILHQLDTALTRLRGGKNSPDQLELYHAAVQLTLGRRQQAGILLEDLHDRVCEARTEELGNYCFYLYLRAVIDDDQNRHKQLVLLLNKFYEESADKDMLLWLLLRTDKVLKDNPSMAMAKLRDRFERGSRNPFLLVEGIKLLADAPHMLENMDDYFRQLLWTGVRYGVMNTALSQVAGRAATMGKHWSESLFRILEGFYAEYPCEECLEGICSLLIKGEKKGERAFYWYEKGVEEDVRLTRLYEYYLYALPEDYDRKLPQIVLMYFSYHHALNRRAQEALYANLLTYCREDEALMESYREQIESFALDQMFQGVMDDRLSEIYRYAIYPEMVDEKTAKVLPRLLLAKRITCDNPEIAQLVLCYEELEDEQIVPLSGGRVYVPVYTDNCLILQQDIYGNRYASLPCVMTDFFEDEQLLEACMEKNQDSDMLSIRTCSRIMSGADDGRITGEKLLSVLRRDQLRPLYVQKLQSKVIAGCCEDDETDSSLYLLSLNPKLMTRAEQIAVTETFIRRGNYRDAYHWVQSWGHEGIASEWLMLLCQNTIQEKSFAPSKRLLNLSVICMADGGFSPSVLEYLCCYYNGSSKQMQHFLKLGREHECNVYDLPERLLGQMLFSGWSENLDEVFFDYAEGNVADEVLVRAYLVTKSFLYFTADVPVMADVFAYLEKLIGSREVHNGMPNVCLMALTKYYSTLDDLNGKQIELCREMVNELYRQGLMFAYYQNLARFIRLPGSLSGKLIIEYRGSKQSSVKLCMRISARDEEKIEEMVPHMYEGYFVKAATVFVGETVDYEIYDSEKGDAPVKSGRMTKSCLVNEDDGSRGSQLNQILVELNGDRETLRRKLERYGAEDTLARQLFTIR
ncbi:MAG: hypothetical protein IJZ85_10110 [Lachnospiraceae bacterium]|nr:hypothetical protein [Lachnospiraceae bacterium]